MKRFNRSPKICTAIVILFGTVLLFAEGAMTQTDPPPPFKVHVTFSQASYNLDDPNEKIDAAITLENISGVDVWTREGFKDNGYHFYLYFKGPGTDGSLISWTSSGSGSPTPSVEPPTVNVEKLDSGWLINMPIPEVRDYYPLTHPGQYRCWFAMPFVQYDTGQVQPAVNDNGDPIPNKYVAPPGAIVWTDPIESQGTFIVLTTGVAAVKSDVRIKAVEYIFGEGSHPGVTKKPLIDIDVRLYKLSAIAAAGISPINHKVYGSIATNDNIFNISADKTGISGEFIFKSVPHDPEGYIVLGRADRITDYKHLGRFVEADDPNWGTGEIYRKLILMTDKRGKKSPGKSKKLTGSELLIIEPEYVEWGSNDELYPFAFESVGDWDVEVSVVPPEGFVADHPSLSESVSSELEGVQFTITEFGSSWKPTKVNYKVKHKNKTQEIVSEIGVKLTKKLSQEKGVDKWGKDDQDEDGNDQGEGQDDQGGKPKKGGEK
jgi:hypothetical protein